MTLPFPKFTSFIVIATINFACGYALAGPEGAYDMTGTNPGDASPYSGTIEVTPNGQTYSVIWRFGKDETKGVGVTHSNTDDIFAVSYGTPSGHGVAVFRRQADGSWLGRWSNIEGKTVGTEIWKPLNGGELSAGSGTNPANASVPQGGGASRP